MIILTRSNIVNDQNESSFKLFLEVHSNEFREV